MSLVYKFYIGYHTNPENDEAGPTRLVIKIKYFY